MDGKQVCVKFGDYDGEDFEHNGLLYTIEDGLSYQELMEGVPTLWDKDKSFIYERVMDYVPWTIEYFHDVLLCRYFVGDLFVFSDLCRSPAQNLFQDYWMHHYFLNKHNPFLIPLFRGMPEDYGYYKNGSGEVSYELKPGFGFIRVCYDFCVMNHAKNLRLLIDLQEPDNIVSDTRGLSRADVSVKARIADMHGWKHCVVSYESLRDDIHKVFEGLDNYFRCD